MLFKKMYNKVTQLHLNHSVLKVWKYQIFHTTTAKMRQNHTKHICCFFVMSFPFMISWLLKLWAPPAGPPLAALLIYIFIMFYIFSFMNNLHVTVPVGVDRPHRLSPAPGDAAAADADMNHIPIYEDSHRCIITCLFCQLFVIICVWKNFYRC